MQTAEAAVSVTNFDIEKFVSEATWKDILLELVKNNELNPWDIDIIEIVGRYVDVVRRMKVLDLRVPANIILAAAILLRLKSEMLELEEHNAAEDAAQEDFIRPSVAVEPLSVRLRLPQRRRVTLAELISALEEAMKLKEYKETAAANEITSIPMNFPRADVEMDIETIYSLVEKNVDQSKMITFSALCDVAKRDEPLLDVFIPLLFLANKGRIFLLQERFFDEIIIGMNN